MNTTSFSTYQGSRPNRYKPPSATDKSRFPNQLAVRWDPETREIKAYVSGRVTDKPEDEALTTALTKLEQLNDMPVEETQGKQNIASLVSHAVSSVKKGCGRVVTTTKTGVEVREVRGSSTWGAKIYDNHNAEDQRLWEQITSQGSGYEQFPLGDYQISKHPEFAAKAGSDTSNLSQKTVTAASAVSEQASRMFRPSGGEQSGSDKSAFRAFRGGRNSQGHRGGYRRGRGGPQSTN